MEPHRPVFRFPQELEPEEWTAEPLQVDPFYELVGSDVLGFYPKRVPVRQLTFFIDRSKQRVDQLAVESPLLVGNPVDIAGKVHSGLNVFNGLNL